MHSETITPKLSKKAKAFVIIFGLCMLSFTLPDIFFADSVDEYHDLSEEYSIPTDLRRRSLAVIAIRQLAAANGDISRLSYVELMYTGILMGILHVVTGPDHLASLATLSGTTSLSASTKPNSSSRMGGSFVLGVKWGVGHSIGLLVVGGILIVIEAGGSSEWIAMNDVHGMIAQGIVGTFMLCLGWYGISKAIRHRNENSADMLMWSDSSSGQQRRRGGKDLDENKERSAEPDVEAPMRKLSSNLDKVNEEDDEHSDDESFFGRDPEAPAPPGGNRRASMEIIRQMSVVLNRDGDEMRETPALRSSHVIGPDYAADVERRVLAAAESLRQNSSLSSSAVRRPPNPKRQGSSSVSSSRSRTPSPSLKRGSESSGQEEEEDEDQFMSSLRGSAIGALSKSFIAILEKPNRPTPMRAMSFMNKHADPDHSIVKDPTEDAWCSRIGRRVGHIFICCSGKKSTTSSAEDGSCCSPGVLAVVAGLLHGAAGSGSVLGIIPAVQLRDPTLSMAYLSVFCITSILVMGAFTALYSSVCFRLAGGNKDNNRVFQVELGSALLSIAVGIIWLVLLASGQMGQFWI